MTTWNTMSNMARAYVYIRLRKEKCLWYLKKKNKKKTHK